MGRKYAATCDICGQTQMEKDAFNIKGVDYKDQFYCMPCDNRLKTAAALGKDGLDDPLAAAGRLLEQRDVRIKNLEMQASARSGDMMGAADELRQKRESGGFVPVVGLDFESQYKQARGLATTGRTTPQHALPAPEPKNKTKKKKK